MCLLCKNKNWKYLALTFNNVLGYKKLGVWDQIFVSQYYYKPIQPVTGLDRSCH